MSTTICCLEPVLAPYSIPRFRALQSQYPEYAVQVLALGATERMREWKVQKQDLGFEYLEAVPGETVENIKSDVLSARVRQWLDECDPQVVAITGYYYPAMRTAAQWARQHGRASIYLGDSQWIDRPRIAVREWLKGRWVQRHYDAAFVAGERAATYLAGMGFPRERIWTGYDVVDNAVFASGAAEARAAAQHVRPRLGLPERFFLFVGRFAPEKNLPRFLDAYARYRRIAGRQAWDLVMAGRGPQDELLQRQAKSIGGVMFAGFQQTEQLPPYYGLASCLVLPSVSETWGLVVNEAMAAGLPVLVSHRCGCVPELVRTGSNGYVCDPLNIDGMAQSMKALSSSGIDLDAMGAASRRIVALYTPETWAQDLADCIERTTARIQEPLAEPVLRRAGLFKAEKQPN